MNRGKIVNDARNSTRKLARVARFREEVADASIGNRYSPLCLRARHYQSPAPEIISYYGRVNRNVRSIERYRSMRSGERYLSAVPCNSDHFFPRFDLIVLPSTIGWQ